MKRSNLIAFTGSDHLLDLTRQGDAPLHHCESHAHFLNDFVT